MITSVLLRVLSDPPFALESESSEGLSGKLEESEKDDDEVLAVGLLRIEKDGMGVRMLKVVSPAEAVVVAISRNGRLVEYSSAAGQTDPSGRGAGK